MKSANGMSGHPPARNLHRYLFECIKRDLADSLQITDGTASPAHASGTFIVAGREFTLTVAPVERSAEVVVLHRKGGA